MTSSRCEGGKAPGSPGAGVVLKALEAFGNKPFTPLADGVAVAVQVVGNGLVGRGVLSGSPQDDATAEDQGLGGRAGADEGFQVRANVGGQFDDGTEGARHGKPPGNLHNSFLLQNIMATHAPFG
jgi:hypothetical protein